MNADQTSLDHAPNEHVINLLSAYIHNALAACDRIHVENHLAGCAICRDEYALAEAMTTGIRRELQAVASPSLTLLDQVWREIDMPSPAAAIMSAAWRHARQLWSLTRAQAPLIPKGI